MAQQRGAKAGKKSAQASQPVSAEEKIARLLGMIVIKDVENRVDQVTLLRSIGFEVSDVSSMLGMSENHVNVAAHHGRKKRDRKVTRKTL